jgi:hypothetical protein
MIVETNFACFATSFSYPPTFDLFNAEQPQKLLRNHATSDFVELTVILSRYPSNIGSTKPRNITPSTPTYLLCYLRIGVGGSF